MYHRFLPGFISIQQASSLAVPLFFSFHSYGKDPWGVFSCDSIHTRKRQIGKQTQKEGDKEKKKSMENKYKRWICSFNRHWHALSWTLLFIVLPFFLSLFITHFLFPHWMIEWITHSRSLVSLCICHLNIPFNISLAIHYLLVPFIAFVSLSHHFRNFIKIFALHFASCSEHLLFNVSVFMFLFSFLFSSFSHRVLCVPIWVEQSVFRWRLANIIIQNCGLMGKMGL